MRIRDWSSDVCSSDLLGRVHRKAPGRIRRSGARRRFPGLNAASAQALRRPPLPILNTSMPETGEYKMSDRYAAYNRLKFRSEEHTSELQSLMRISYAVFCLKKKNTTIQNQTRNNKDLHNHKIK